MQSPYYAPNQYASLQTQGHYQTPPYYPPRRKSRGSGCLGTCCCCWGGIICCCLFIVIILVVVLVYFMSAIKLYIPSYNFDNMHVNSFEFRNDSKVHSEITIVVKAENPSKSFGLDYGENNITVLYSGSQLSSGNFQPFLQPGANTTWINLVMKGENEFGSDKQQEFLKKNTEGKIPLLITARIPVRIVVFDLIRLKKIVVNVNCSLEIDHLEPNKKTNILKKDFTFY